MNIRSTLFTAAVLAMGAAACTVSVNGDDSGIFDDAGSDAGGGDSGDMDATPDTGVDAGPVCEAIGTTQPPASITFDNGGTCDTCMSASCCSQVTACFASVDGGDSDCYQLDQCLSNCVAPDGGIDQTCVDACNAAHSASTAMWKAQADCLTTNCDSACQ